MPRAGRTAPLLATALVALGVVPGAATAHEVAGSRFDAPVPLSLLFAGAAATVALTALWLAVGAGVPRGAERRVLTLPAPVVTPLRRAVGVVFLGVVVAALVHGVAGPRAAPENGATSFTWSVWFHGVALLAVLFGTPWRALSPWRTVYRALCRLEGRTVAVLGAVPAVPGAWSALLGFALLVGVLENLTAVPRSPPLTTAAVAVYGLAMVGGAVLFGPKWLRRADPLGVCYRLLGRVAPLGLDRTDDGYDVVVRPPWRGCLAPVRGLPVVAFVVAAVYTVSFDGFAGTRTFETVLFATRDATGTGAGASAALYLAGLGGFVAAFAAVCWAAERLGAGVAAVSGGSASDWRAATRAFAPTVLPIAAAYEVAHNYPFVVDGAARTLSLAGHPAGLVAAPPAPLDWLSLPAFWASQVALVVVGHLVAVVAAHHVAVERYGVGARRGHLPLVALMVGYTVLSLWIVSRPVVSV